jgi:hypothetical protein
MISTRHIMSHLGCVAALLLCGGGPIFAASPLHSPKHRDIWPDCPMRNRVAHVVIPAPPALPPPLMAIDFPPFPEPRPTIVTTTLPTENYLSQEVVTVTMPKKLKVVQPVSTLTIGRITGESEVTPASASVPVRYDPVTRTIYIPAEGGEITFNVPCSNQPVVKVTATIPAGESGHFQHNDGGGWVDNNVQVDGPSFFNYTEVIPAVSRFFRIKQR